MQETNRNPFAFTNLTNLKIPTVETAPHKQAVTDKLKALAACKAASATPDSFVFDELARKALFRGSLSSLRLLRSAERVAAPRAAVLRKLNCNYFRGKKAVLKTPSVRICFEIVEELN